MNGELFDVHRTLTNNCPDGVFDGEWSGYKVTFNAFGAEFTARANTGIRGTAKCKVNIKDGKHAVQI